MNVGRTCLILIFAAVGGCATPQLKHAELERAVIDASPLTDAYIAQLSGVTYHATSSLLRIDDRTGDEDHATLDFMGASLPVAADDRIYVAYAKAGTWGLTRTYLGAKYVPNTRILSDLGVQVKDDRKQFITALGSMLAPFVAAAPAPITEARPAPPVVAAADPKPVFPFVRDSAVDLECDPAKDCRAGKAVEFSCLATKVDEPDFVTKKECGKVTYGALPKDAAPRASYLKAVKDRWTDSFPVPACRSATLVLYAWNELQGTNSAPVNPVTFETVVSDPNYVRIVKLPPAGSVAFHPSCGTDVLTGDVVTDPVWAAIAELGAQTKAIKDAQKPPQTTGNAKRADSAPTQPRN